MEISHAALDTFDKTGGDGHRAGAGTGVGGFDLSPLGRRAARNAAGRGKRRSKGKGPMVVIAVGDDP